MLGAEHEDERRDQRERVNDIHGQSHCGGFSLRSARHACRARESMLPTRPIASVQCSQSGLLICRPAVGSIVTRQLVDSPHVTQALASTGAIAWLTLIMPPKLQRDRA